MTTYMMFGDKTKADAIMTIVQKGIMEILERMNQIYKSIFLLWIYKGVHVLIHIFSCVKTWNEE